MSVDVSTTQELRHASHSSLSKHRICPQQWYYSAVRGLRKADSEDAPVERDFGSWFHCLRAADSISRGEEKRSLRWTPKTLTTVDDGPTLPGEGVTTAQVMDLAQAWWDKQSLQSREAYVERLGEGLPERLWALYTRWREYWASDILHELPLAVELPWERRLPAQPGPQDLDPYTVLVGYVDEIYMDKRRGIIVVRDIKTSKKLNAQSTVDDMMDSQLQLYAWGATPEVMSWGLGHICATQYDRARTVKPQDPRLTLSGTLSKAVSDYDLHTYQQFCKTKPRYAGRKKDGSDGGVYAQEQREVERLSAPAARSSWFQRTGPTPLNINLVRSHLRAAVDSALDMNATRERAELTHSASRNFSGMACRWCDFSELCRSEMFGGAAGDFDPADFRLVSKNRSGR